MTTPAAFIGIIQNYLIKFDKNNKNTFRYSYIPRDVDGCGAMMCGWPD